MKSRRIRLVETTVERTARMLAREYGIKVVWKGQEARTNGKTIILPVLPDDAPDELLEAVQGYLDHETAHIIFTDFDLLTKYSPKPSPEQMQCIGVVEDTRIEAAMGKLYPGTPYNLHKVHDWIYPTLVKHWDKINPFKKAITAYFDYEKYGETEFWEKTVEPEIKDMMLQCVKAVGDYNKINSTADAIPAGLRMFEVLKDLAEQEKKEREEREEKQKAESKGKPQTGAGQPQPGGVKDENGQPIVTTVGELAAAISQSAKQAVEENNGKIPVGGSNYQHKQEEAGYLVYTTQGDTTQSMPDGNLAKNGQNLLRLREESREMTSVIQTRLVNSLRSSQRRRWVGGKEDGKLDTRRLHHAMLGTSDNVYKQLTDKQALNTVVGLAIDHSGSMSGTRLELAGKAAIVVGDALNVLRVPFMVYGYSTEDPHEQPQDTKAYARWGHLWIRYYRDFAEPWDKGAIRLAGSMHNCKNNTLDGESVKHGIQRLLLRPEKRKILLVLNDGMPYPSYGNLGQCQQYLHDVVGSAKGVGVEVVAFGIQSPDVKEYYPNHVVIHKLEDLVAEPLATLDKMLRGGVQMK